jgi:hypothetical protein
MARFEWRSLLRWLLSAGPLTRRDAARLLVLPALSAGSACAQGVEPVPLNARAVVITGRVTSSTGREVAGAIVVPRGRVGDSAITNAQGLYRLVTRPSAPGRRLVLAVHADGMLPGSRRVRAAHESLQVNVVLRQRAGQLESVVVRAAPGSDRVRYDCYCVAVQNFGLPSGLPPIPVPVSAPAVVRPGPLPSPR